MCCPDLCTPSNSQIVPPRQATVTAGHHALAISRRHLDACAVKLSKFRSHDTAGNTSLHALAEGLLALGQVRNALKTRGPQLEVVATAVVNALTRPVPSPEVWTPRELTRHELDCLGELQASLHLWRCVHKIFG